MNIWKKILEAKWHYITFVLENQFDFMPRRLMTKAIHILRHLMENYREINRDLHIMLINVEKT